MCQTNGVDMGMISGTGDKSRLGTTNVLLRMELCVEWGSNNAGWHIDVHHVKIFCTHIAKV